MLVVEHSTCTQGEAVLPPTPHPPHIGNASAHHPSSRPHAFRACSPCPDASAVPFGLRLHGFSEEGGTLAMLDAPEGLLETPVSGPTSALLVSIYSFTSKLSH